MARKRYEVVPAGTLWALKYLGAILGSNALKSAVVDMGVRVARSNQPSQLVIRRQNGTIEDERTYGDDPYPPRG